MVLLLFGNHRTFLKVSIKLSLVFRNYSSYLFLVNTQQLVYIHLYHLYYWTYGQCPGSSTLHSTIASQSEMSLNHVAVFLFLVTYILVFIEDCVIIPLFIIFVVLWLFGRGHRRFRQVWKCSKLLWKSFALVQSRK